MRASGASSSTSRGPRRAPSRPRPRPRPSTRVARMRWRPLSALLAVACSLSVAGPVGAQVASGSKTLNSGQVSATLSWKGGADIVATDPHLRIARGGAPLLDSDLAKECQLCNGVGAPGEALHVTDLDAEGEPEVLVDLYTGGAHCCATTLIWFFDGSGYRRRVLGLGDQGYRLRDLDADGQPEIVTADDRFAYAFTAFAYSWFPPLVYDWRGHALVDVTRRFPSRIRADLAAIRKVLPRARRDGDPRGLVAAYAPPSPGGTRPAPAAFRKVFPRARRDGDPRGLVAAYAADEYLLGRGKAARAYLRGALRRGDLRAIPAGDATWPSGRSYAPALLRFLHKAGYR